MIDNWSKTCLFVKYSSLMIDWFDCSQQLFYTVNIFMLSLVYYGLAMGKKGFLQRWGKWNALK